MQPRVSFVVPCYNYDRFVAQAIDSLLGQTFQSLEIIVVDDASTDSSPQVLSAYEADPRVSVIRHTTNQGHLRSYNEGLSLARGEYIGLLSADDFCMRSDAVERQVACFDANPGVGFVTSNYAVTDEDGIVQFVKNGWQHDAVAEGLEEFSRLVFECYIPHSGTLVRRRCHDELGYYDLRLPHAADWDMWLRISAHYDVAYLADPLFAYRVHWGNMHHSKLSPMETTSDHVLTITKAFEELPADAPAEIRDLRKPALQQAWLRSAAIECSSGRTMRAFTALKDVAVREPSLIITRAFAVASAKVGVEMVVGHDNYNKLASRWRSRGVSTSPTQAG